LTKKIVFVSLNADREGRGSNLDYLLPIPGAFKRREELHYLYLKEIFTKGRKEVKGSEEEAEFNRGSSGIIGLFLWLCGVCFKGNQIEMSKVWSRFHRG